MKRHSFNPLPQSPIAIFTYLIFTGVSRVDLIIKPEVSNSHPVLCESPCLVGADDGGRTECFYSFQVLHQTVLLGHPFGCQRQAHLAEVQLMVSEVQLQNGAVRFHTSARLFVITCFFRKRTFFKMYLLLDCGGFCFSYFNSVIKV